MKTVYAVSKGQRFNSDTTLVVVTCHSCKMPYAIPESLHRAMQAWPGGGPKSWRVFCPLGHEWWYLGETPEEKLEAQREQTRRARDAAARARAEADQAKASARAEKAAKTRIRNSRERERQRVANGVCPCCKRTFANLARHMASQHPDHAHHGQPS